MEPLTPALSESLCCVHPRYLIAIMDYLRSSQIFTAEALTWQCDDISPEAILRLISDLRSAGMIQMFDDHHFELSEYGEVEINRFFDAIGWARRGGRWDQPLSVAYGVALQLYDSLARDPQEVDIETARRILDLLSTALVQEQNLPGVIFEAVWIGGGNAAVSQSVRCGMVSWLQSKVYEWLGNVVQACFALRDAYDQFWENGRVDLAVSVRSDFERLWALIGVTRTVGEQKELQIELGQWWVEHRFDAPTVRFQWEALAADLAPPRFSTRESRRSIQQRSPTLFSSLNLVDPVSATVEATPYDDPAAAALAMAYLPELASAEGSREPETAEIALALLRRAEEDTPKTREEWDRLVEEVAPQEMTT
jgi:hypothetical protein